MKSKRGLVTYIGVSNLVFLLSSLSLATQSTSACLHLSMPYTGCLHRTRLWLNTLLSFQKHDSHPISMHTFLKAYA